MQEPMVPPPVQTAKASDTTGSIQNTDGSTVTGGHRVLLDEIAHETANSSVIPAPPPQPWKQSQSQKQDHANETSSRSHCLSRKGIWMALTFVVILIAVIVTVSVVLVSKDDDDGSSSSSDPDIVSFENPDKVQWVMKGNKLVDPFPLEGGLVGGNALVRMNADATRLIVPDSFFARKEVYVYDYNETSKDWDFQAVLQGDQPLGLAISADGNSIVIGSKKEGEGPLYSLNTITDKVVTYDFDTESREWKRLDQVIAETQENDRTGRSVHLNADGTKLLVGSPSHQGVVAGSGLVRMFARDASGAWELEWRVFGDGTIGNVGGSMKLTGDGERFVNGSPITSTIGGVSSQGIVSVFQQSTEGDNEWSLVGSVIRGDNPADTIGGDVELSTDGNTMAYDDSDYQFVGNIHVYEFSSQSGDWELLGEPIASCVPEINWDYCLSGTGRVVVVACKTIVLVFQYDRAQNAWAEVNPIEIETSGDEYINVRCSYDGRQVGLLVYDADLGESYVTVWTAVDEER